MIVRSSFTGAIKTPRLLRAEPCHVAWLPCLYLTRTITRAYTSQEGVHDGSQYFQDEIVSTATQDRSSHAGLADTSLQGERGETPMRPRQHKRSPPRKHYRGRFPRQDGNSTENPGALRRNTSARTSAPRGGPYIPFEGQAATLAPGEQLRGSTITNWEFEVFQSLFKKSSDAATAAAADNLRKDNWDGQHISELIDSAKNPTVDRTQASARAFPQALQSFAQEIEQARRLAAAAILEDDTKEDSALSFKEKEKFLAARRALDKTRNQMDAATTDIELWQVLERRVFALLRKWKLDRVHPSATVVPKAELALPGESNNTGNEKTEKQKGKLDEVADDGSVIEKQLDTTSSPANKQKVSPIINWELFVMEQSLSDLLAHFLELMQTSFPGSMLALSLLPTLKKIGPAAFALAASTKIYNLHMQILYRRYNDLDAVVNVLVEMDREVYEFDHDTQTLLAAIMHRAELGRQNRLAVGENALWQTDHRLRVMESISGWLATIDGRMQEVALRKAREQQSGFDEGNAVEDRDAESAELRDDLIAAA